MPSGKFAKDIAGQQFHNWTVVHRLDNDKFNRARWLCVCECGAERNVSGLSLMNGSSKSCGCHQKQVASQVNSTHGMRQSRAYRIWCAMKSRCDNPNAESYPNYGGRGITYCKEWAEFEAFLSDMGEPADGMTIERIDNAGKYEPSNCRWATMKEQCNNKRNNHFIEYNGRKLTATQWQDETGIKESTIRRRLGLGWPVARALSEQPIIGRNQHRV